MAAERLERDMESVQTSDVEENSSQVEKGAAHCINCFKQKNDRGGYDFCICHEHGDCSLSMFIPPRAETPTVKKEETEAPSGKEAEKKTEAPDDAQSVQTEDVSDYHLQEGTAHCKKCTKHKRPTGTADYVICKDHGEFDMTTFPPVEVIRKKPRKEVGCYEETTKEHPRQEPFFLRLTALEKEIGEAHSRDHNEAGTAHLLYSDGTIGYTKGGKNLFWNNSKPLLPAVLNRQILKLPVKDEDRRFTAAVLLLEKAKEFRQRLKQLVGVPESFEGTRDDAANEDSLEDLWKTK